jgi:TRAP-type C4-dicarboxylate transport system permease small subunit
LRKALATACGAVASVALFGIMLLTLVDVAGRKFLNASIPGSLELTELLMVAVIFAALPLVSLAGEHIVFDSLDRWQPDGLRRVQQSIVDLLCAGALLGLAWLMWLKAGQLASYGDTTPQLKLPVAPFVYAMSVCCVLTAVVHVMLMREPVAHHHVGVQDPPAGA